MRHLRRYIAIKYVHHRRLVINKREITAAGNIYLRMRSILVYTDNMKRFVYALYRKTYRVYALYFAMPLLLACFSYPYINVYNDAGGVRITIDKNKRIFNVHNMGFT